MGGLAKGLKPLGEDTTPSLPATIERNPPVPVTNSEPLAETMPTGSKKLLISVDLNAHSDLKMIAAKRRVTLEIACRDLLIKSAKAELRELFK